MKNRIVDILIFIFIALVISSCTKQESVSPMVFKFIGIKDTTITQGKSVTNPIVIYNLGGGREKITFTARNLPNGVQITHTPSSAYQETNVTEIVSVSSTADTGSYTIQIIGTAEKGNTYQKDYHLHIVAPVNKAPVITLTGGNTFSVILNSGYTEPGFIAMDAEDGNITANVQVTGTVNKDSTGTYTLSYVVTDSQGLKDSVTRAVSVANFLNFLNIQFTDTTYNLTNGKHYEWITSMTASHTVNNQFVIYKISNCFPANPTLTFTFQDTSTANNLQTG